MLKSYASYFAAYLLNHLKDISTIQRVVLYGSVARDQATKGSDVDIFIEVKKKTSSIEKEIREAEKDFYQSREASLFKAKGIDNVFSIKIGRLHEWKGLYPSIASTGIILYGPYEAKELPSGVKQHIIVFWDKIGLNRGSFLNKLYGVKIKEKRYAGLLEKYQGKKIGKSCIMLPVEYKEELFKTLHAHRVKAHIVEVFS